jgi:hypothetical protein
LKEVISPRIIVDTNRWIGNVVDYVKRRQNSDGGYTFCQGTESNAQDTCYGLAILNLLGSPFPRVEKTIKWLLEFDLDSVYSYYYVGKALVLCGKHLDNRFREHVAALVNSNRYFGNVNVYVEVSSEFALTLMILELANLLGVKLDGGEAEKWLLEYVNEDGGFGAHGHSNISSTYHAVASLNLLKYDVKNLRDTVAFVRECEQPRGGFTIIPGSLICYMEFTYFGVMALDLLGESCRFKAQTTDFILRCQRANGGFARSDPGISTFENTFQAVSMLAKFGVIQSAN